MPYFYDRQGEPLNGGRIYLGVEDMDPETNPIDTYWDSGYTLDTGTIKTIGGLVVNDGTPALVYFEEENYSIRVRDSDGDEVYYRPSAIVAGTAPQPLDSDLTAIAALSTTTYGRALLTLADQAALATATGITPGLATTGGAMTGNITRSGAGIHLYWTSASGVTSGEVHVIDNGDAKPSTGLVFEKV